jgi:hypothetical protein
MARRRLPDSVEQLVLLGAALVITDAAGNAGQLRHASILASGATTDRVAPRSTVLRGWEPRSERLEAGLGSAVHPRLLIEGEQVRVD